VTPTDSANRQELVGYRTNEEWQDLVAQAGAMISALDAIEDESVKSNVFNALEGVDALHREALHRLVRLFKEGVLEQVITDPAINTLMGMYDLLPPEEPACQKVWDFIPDQSADGAPKTTVSGISSGDPAHWSPAPLDGPLAEGAAFLVRMEEGSLLVVRYDGRDHALSALCQTHGAEMVNGRLDGASWICPHGPGCAYDVRNGARLGGGPGLDCFNVKTDDQNRLLIGFGMPFEPVMPSF